ncbi:glycoside hydrolase family 35 protein [Durotheca rogersii]|uniref:glycoside hydrolase family 35 protein n=1 Tax=Durotheca rogersii TaxID=419775 RepID=UPI0022200CD3|nr:glycoside hydrolase family 35 protein [Durotheca rogersii]KAI5867902.1 glycoside hydrolase family 35 protein [Durotheca rogersii]
MRSSFLLATVTHALLGFALAVPGFADTTIWNSLDKRADPAQDIVTWDEHSLFVRGERVMIFSGEVHPFRLPVPSLWVDVLEKVKALGFNCVSFYVDWALLEATPGEFSADGVFDLRLFFDAATQAGIYLIARPGPYINAEVSGGGFPGWLQRVRGGLRTRAPDFLNATDNYMANIGKLIADAQITNGGPVILFQPENEYTWAEEYTPFPDGSYMEYVLQQARDAGIVVPFISNDASALGHNAPGTGLGEVDIYGHDGYPLGFDCANPTTWPDGNLPSTYRSNHYRHSPTTPFSLLEFQGGSFDPWGGWGFEQCGRLLNHEFERVFYKNNYAAGVKIYNIYMIFGGTNWGNLGHPGGYTSYDYGAAIGEDRTVAREKYSELKLQATFLTSSPGYLTAVPGESVRGGAYADNTDITVTPVLADQATPDAGSFFVIRHTAYGSLDSTPYRLTLPTSRGSISIPQLANGTLTLNGRDSKVFVTDYAVPGGTTLLYSTAEVFTHIAVDNRAVLVLYGGPGEYNEFSVQGSPAQLRKLEGDDSAFTLTQSNSTDGFVVVGWRAVSEVIILQVDNTQIYLLDRNTAYTFWRTEIANSTSQLIVSGPYLVRSAAIEGDELHLRADFNESSTTVSVIGAPSQVTSLTVNGLPAPLLEPRTVSGALVANITVSKPVISLPTLADLDWRTFDSLPEKQPDFDDAAWLAADREYTDNTFRPLLAVQSTYASDYGFHSGVLVYRGHFNATGSETTFALLTRGGDASAASVFLDDTLLGAFSGSPATDEHRGRFDLTPFSLPAGSAHVFTVVLENTGLDETGVGSDSMKSPRGVLGWRLETARATSTPVRWRIAGNLGGERDRRDRARGPLNEGGLAAERRGYHLPGAPTASWAQRSPLQGLDGPGVALYVATFELDLPADQWDVPLAFAFANNTDASGAYRAQLYVNGWQFGKLASNLGPQTTFPVPEGILDYGGANTVAVILWALEERGARIGDLELVAAEPVWTGRRRVELVSSPVWAERQGAN